MSSVLTRAWLHRSGLRAFLLLRGGVRGTAEDPRDTGDVCGVCLSAGGTWGGGYGEKKKKIQSRLVSISQPLC